MAQLPGKVVQFVVESGLAAVVQKAGAQRDEREDVGDEFTPRAGRMSTVLARASRNAARPMTLSRT